MSKQLRRIGLHTFVWLNAPCRISTVQLSPSLFETMVMFDDGDEIEVFHTATVEDARRIHNETMHRWNDRIYESSTARLLGVQNYGQFVHTVVSC